MPSDSNRVFKHFDDFHWLNKPLTHSLSGGLLTIRSNAKTDFWQRTHYGFKRDTGHCFLKTVSGDFSIHTMARFKPKSQFDQCGLMARIDSENWIKCSTEYENSELSRLGSVVTNLGYSDWATQEVSTEISSMWYRLSRSGNDVFIEHSSDGKVWQQMRVAHLHQLERSLDVGIYACSPIGTGFICSFQHI